MIIANQSGYGDEYPRGARYMARTWRHNLAFGGSDWDLDHDAAMRIGQRSSLVVAPI
jgi:hypothetical protein